MAKFRLPPPEPDRFTYMYECVNCKTRTEYVIELPVHLRTHGYEPGQMKPCNGLLVLVEKIPKKR